MLELLHCHPRTTALHQLLDLRMIGAYKVRYRSLLLRSVINVMASKFSGKVEFRSDAQRGKHGIRDGQRLHMVDAIDIFNLAWSANQNSAVIKCWLKSSCLLESHSTLSREYLQSTAGFIYPTIQGFPRNAVDASTPTHNFNDIRSIPSADYSLPNAPVIEVLQDVEEIMELSELIAALNSTAPFDVDPTSTELADFLLQSMFDGSREPTAHSNERSQE